jgi:putative endonuclease
MFIVYILQSLKDGSIYVGYTQDMNRRLSQHNAGKNKSTKQKTPWRLVYCECFLSKTDALIRERKLKNHGKGIAELKKRIENSLKTKTSETKR